MASLVDVHTKFAYNRKRLDRVMMANEEAGTRENPLYMSEFVSRHDEISAIATESTCTRGAATSERPTRTLTVLASTKSEKLLT